MHKKADIILGWEIEDLEYYIQNGLKYNIEILKKDYADTKDRIRGEKEQATASFRIYKRSILYELNALIEHWLLFASSDDGTFFDDNNLKRSRSDSIKIISIKYQIPLNTISCFEEIELIKTMVNSLKHRGGYSFTDYSEAGNKFNSVNDSIEHILYLKESAFKFIKELISAIIIIEHENT
jgi:hypothetical protein